MGKNSSVVGVQLHKEMSELEALVEAKVRL
jgi:hypothetical protein